MASLKKMHFTIVSVYDIFYRSIYQASTQNQTKQTLTQLIDKTSQNFQPKTSRKSTKSRDRPPTN